MPVAVNVTNDEVINSIAVMSFDELEKLKNIIIKRSLYFKRYRKVPIENVISDFKAEGYTDEFLNDLEDGLRKSSVYENKTA